MALHRFLVVAFSVATAFIGPCAWAQATPAGNATVDVGAWLTRIHEAASLRNYQGTQVFMAGGTMSSSRIAHYCDGSHEYERVDMLDGQMRRVYRHNDIVYTLWPQKQLAIVEQQEALPPFPALLQSAEGRVADHYELRSQGVDRIAGYDAQVFLLRPRDTYRFAQRLWSEKATGLLLRADVIGPRDEVLESSSFSEVAIGVRPQVDTVVQPMKRLEGYRIVRAAVAPTQLEAEGWKLAQPLAGFRQISCVKRPLDFVPENNGGTPVEVLQTIYSDGLTHVSVFIEPFDPKRHQRAMHTAVGATHTLMRRQGDWWVTVVGDVPTSTLKLFAAALERQRK